MYETNTAIRNNYINRAGRSIDGYPRLVKQSQLTSFCMVRIARNEFAKQSVRQGKLA